jgi:hypothetical protein
MFNNHSLSSFIFESKKLTLLREQMLTLVFYGTQGKFVCFFLVREQLLPGELEFSDQDNFGLDGPAQVR